MQRRKTALQLIVALACLAPTPTLLARDGTIYPGGMCTAQGANHYDAWAMISNPSTTVRLHVECPIVRQQTERGIDPGSWVRLIDQHTTQNATCEIVTTEFVSLTSGAAWYSGSVSTTGWGERVQQRGFGGMGANNASQSFLMCDLPPVEGGRKSYLTTYKIEENS